MRYSRLVEVQNMNKENSKDKNGSFHLETPLEFVGFGFLIMLIFGAVWFFATQGETVEEFAWAMIFVYGIIAGPFILYGTLSTLGVFKYFHIPNAQPGSVALAHYAALVARMSNVSHKYSIIVFVVTFIASMIFSHLSDKRKKDK